MSYATSFSALNAVRRQLVPVMVGPGVELSVELVPGHLGIALAVQSDSGRRPVTEADLKRWNVALEGLLPLAIENLRRDSSDRNWAPVAGVENMLVYVNQGGNAAARSLLLPSAFEGKWPLAGIVAAMPAPDQLILVTLDRLEDLDALNTTTVATRLAWERMSDRLSDQLFWFDGQRWECLEVSHENEQVEIRPSPAFLSALEQLSSMTLATTLGSAAEA